MPKQRFERNAPTHEWQQLHPLLKDPTQLTYEIIRPVILGWETPKERDVTPWKPPGQVRAGISPLLLAW